MVVVDGHFFQVRSAGSVREVPHKVLSPFAAVTAFSPDQSITVENCPDLSLPDFSVRRLAPIFRTRRHAVSSLAAVSYFGSGINRGARKIAEISTRMSMPGELFIQDMKGFAAFWPEAKYGKMRIEGRDPVNA